MYTLAADTFSNMMHTFKQRKIAFTALTSFHCMINTIMVSSKLLFSVYSRRFAFHEQSESTSTVPMSSRSIVMMVSQLNA